uniref:Uncharacterized protein n=1 Tax=Siphoviridae sp. ctomJ2 TaxID=2827593 RepID=A0A8S5LKJ6_9CAUD|nr:MAG TPA: Protein of unknown function (DUF722) [Siphoviridae sp. ctomJ2]
MTLKELSQLYYLNREIEDLTNKIAELEAKATDTSVKITGMPRGSGTGDKIGRAVEELCYYKSKLINRLAQCRIELIRLNDYISACPDSLTRQILTYRFVNGLSWNQVATHIGYPATEWSVKDAAYRYIRKN